MNNISIPYNDVFFYGVSLRSRDVSDVRSDIFANILMKYLMSLKPVSNKLYRVSEGNRFEYSYSFIPSKQLNWRVIKNRRVIEEIEQLSDGKYCLNYYDNHGNDVKRIIFNSRNRWVKTNYYNSIYGDNLLCSLVPKEHNGETVILQYDTGVTYPVTLHCCSVASCDQVLDNVLARVPEPEVMALTNYGLLYFACEETRNIYEQILKEEEEKYALAHRPAVYNTEEDVANGFCFKADSFDSTKNSDSLFDLNMADELTEDGFSSFLQESVHISENEDDSVDSLAFDGSSDDSLLSDIPEPDDVDICSIDEQIAAAIKLISETTNITIDESLVFSDNVQELQEVDLSIADESHTDQDLINIEEIDPEAEDVIKPDEILTFSEAEPELSLESDADDVTYDDVDFLRMDDEAIDDYVSTLIDSMLLDAHSTASDHHIAKDDVTFVSPDSELSDPDEKYKQAPSEVYIQENAPDATIESNGASYFYYGDIDLNGNRSGRGRTLMADGKTAYDGEYLDDARHGKGAFYYKEGSLCYWGDWDNNLRNGFGLGISSETGVIHIGNWNQNKPDGIGVRFDSNGNFMYIDSACERTNGGIRITDFTDKTLTIELWDEKTFKVIKKVISVEDLLK